MWSTPQDRSTAASNGSSPEKDAFHSIPPTQRIAAAWKIILDATKEIAAENDLPERGPLHIAAAALGAVAALALQDAYKTG